jgi:hypothetical protein
MSFLNKNVKQAEKQMMLPFWKEEHRAMPNHIARSALFTPIKKGARTFHNKEIISSRCDVEITYTGLRLDEADADLWMQLLHHFRNTSPGNKFFINRARLLTELGKSRGKESYKWLEDSMNRLHGSISIKSKRYKISSTLLQIYATDEETNDYYFKIDKAIVQLFSNKEFSLIQWNKRKKLKYALSKTLQRHIATSSSIEQSYFYSDLKERFKRSGETKYLKRDLKKACEELLAHHIIFKYELRKDKLKIWRTKITS